LKQGKFITNISKKNSKCRKKGVEILLFSEVGWLTRREMLLCLATEIHHNTTFDR